MGSPSWTTNAVSKSAFVTEETAVKGANALLKTVEPPLTNIVPVHVRETASAFIVEYPLLVPRETPNDERHTEVIVYKLEPKVEVVWGATGVVFGKQGNRDMTNSTKNAGEGKR